jgi:hypothetical protein
LFGDTHSMTDEQSTAIVHAASAKLVAQRLSQTAGIVAIVVGCWSLGPAPAQAHRHDFAFTYDWKQPYAGEREVEAHSTYQKSDTSLEEEVEYEYGISQRFSVAPYAVFERGPGESLKYKGYQLETRYQLVDFQTNKVLSGLYEEYAKPNDETGRLESRIVLSYYSDRGDDWSFNYVLTNQFASDPHFNHTYSIGYARQIGASKHDYRGGAEWIHDTTGNRINFGPILGFAPTQHTSLVAGYAFALNKNDGNNDEARLIAEYEW